LPGTYAAPQRFEGQGGAAGTIVRGPASTPQPCCQTRMQDEHIEVRAFT
jgi:hypothetical protein